MEQSVKSLGVAPVVIASLQPKTASKSHRFASRLWHPLGWGSFTGKGSTDWVTNGFPES